MEQARTLTNEEYIISLLELLTQNKNKDQANSIYEMCVHIESMEHKMELMEKELTQVKQQIQMLHGGGAIRKTKELVNRVSSHLQEQYQTTKQEIKSARGYMITTAKNIVEQVKQTGKKALISVVAFTGMKEKLASIKVRVEGNIQDVNQTIDKISEFTTVVKNANQQVKNAARILVNKEEKDYSNQKPKNRMAELLSSPWRVQRGLLEGIEMHASSVLSGIERLEKEVDRIKDGEENPKEEEIEKVTGDVIDAAVVAEESTYGLDAYDAYIEENGTEKLQEKVQESGGGREERGWFI